MGAANASHPLRKVYRKANWEFQPERVTMLAGGVLESGRSNPPCGDLLRAKL